MVANLLHGGIAGELEVRAAPDGAVRLRGAFPYESRALMSSSGPGARREEQFAPQAFAGRVGDPNADIYLLAGHDITKPLASRKAGSLQLSDSANALRFEATVTRAVADTSHGRDAIALLSADLATGLSPGFTVARDAAGTRAENVMQEADGTILRTIHRADLFELSIVTLPAYAAAQVEARNWQPDRQGAAPPAFLKRWRY